MKIVVNIARVLVGSLFIFSGLVKAIDPLDLVTRCRSSLKRGPPDGFLPQLMSTAAHTGITIFSDHHRC
jgi:hypothetical protein